MRLELSRALFVLPNLFTFASIFCGFYATLLAGAAQAGSRDLYQAALYILLSMLLDTVDGRVARLTRTQSAFGVQIDSLADVVSFGVAPSVLVYRWLLQDLGGLGLVVAFAYLGCGAARLARFNVLAMSSDGRPKKVSQHILGLPIPAAAGLLVSLVVASYSLSDDVRAAPVPVAIGVFVLSILMVSSLRFRSFKDLRPTARTVLAISAILMSTIWLSLRFHPAFAVSWLLTAYVALALIEAILRRVRRRPG